MIVTHAGRSTPDDLIHLMNRELQGLRQRSAIYSMVQDPQLPPATELERKMRPIACAGCFFAPDCTSGCTTPTQTRAN